MISERTKNIIETKVESNRFKHNGHTHTFAEWLMIMEYVLQEAKRDWYQYGECTAIEKVISATAVGVEIIEQSKAYKTLQESMTGSVKKDS